MMPATMGSNRNSHSSGSMSCVAPLLMSSDHFGHRSEANRTPFRRCRTPCRRTGKVSDMISESLSDINRNRCPTSIGMPVRYESEWVSDQRRNTQLACQEKCTRLRVDPLFDPFFGNHKTAQTMG